MQSTRTALRPANSGNTNQAADSADAETARNKLAVLCKQVNDSRQGSHMVKLSISGAKIDLKDRPAGNTLAYGQYVYADNKDITWVHGVPQVSSRKGNTKKTAPSRNATITSGDWVGIEQDSDTPLGFRFYYKGRKPAGFKGIVVLPSVTGKPSVRVDIFKNLVL